MTRLEALKSMLAKVEAGTATRERFCFPSGVGWYSEYEWIAWMAYTGSLDAAKALHKELLPGWVFDVTNGSAFVLEDIEDTDGRQFVGEADTPARAWLIAIIKALIAKEAD